MSPAAHVFGESVTPQQEVLDPSKQEARKLRNQQKAHTFA